MIFISSVQVFGGVNQMRKIKFTGDLGNDCVPKKEGGMGFKNLHWFNMAMLAKQSWRLLKNPDSLIARLYKAIYFPNGEYHTAALGDSPSFSWSIIEARQVLVQGLRLKVGNGENIEKWNHNWIPDTYPRGPSSPPSQNAPRFVVELIDQDTCSWNVELLERYFTQTDIDLILSRPLTRQAHSDRQIGHFQKRGIFTTNSAYFVARDLALGVILAPSPPVDPYKAVWKTIWDAKIPAKVAMHSWKATASILPTREGLIAKGYDGEMGCLLCPHILENSLHVFADCPYAKEVWHRANLSLPIGNGVNFTDWFLNVITSLTKEQIAGFLMLLWGIWKNRNSLLLEQKSQHASEAVLLTLGWYEEFKIVNVQPTEQRRKYVKWTRPPESWVKVNCDGAFQPATKKGGAGVVIRDANGDFQAGTSSLLPLITSLFHAELVALREGIYPAASLQYDQVLLESDCSLLVQAIYATDPDLSTMSLMVDEVRQLLQNHVGYRINMFQGKQI